MNVVHAVGRRSRWLVILCAAMAAAGCADGTPTSPALPAPMEDAQLVARSLAGAMADDAVRHAVRDAMRFSDVDGHRIVLQAYLATADGAGLAEAASRAAGMDAAEFQRRVNALPPLDFYMPVRAHRRTWEGDARIAVIAAREGGEFVPAYTPQGRVLQASRTSAEGLPPFFFLEPAERVGRRVGAQPARPGRVIEDANDGTGSEVFVFRGPGGDSVVIDVARLSPGERDALFYTSAPMDTTRVGAFEHYNCDNGYCWTDAEFRFDARYYNASGALLGTGSYYRGSMAPGVLYNLNAPLIYQRMLIGSGEYMTVNLTEEDRGDTFGFNNDDYCGVVTLGPQSYGAWKTYGNQGGCEGGVDEGYLFGYVADARFDWTPKTAPNPPPPPAPYWVTIQGPSTMQPGQTCNWYASHNVPDPSYQWYVDGVLVGTDADLIYTGNSSFQLQVQVNSAQGGGQGASLYVDVSTSNPACAFQ